MSEGESGEGSLVDTLRQIRETVNGVMTEVRALRRTILGDIVVRKPIREAIRQRLGIPIFRGRWLDEKGGKEA